MSIGTGLSVRGSQGWTIRNGDTWEVAMPLTFAGRAPKWKTCAVHCADQPPETAGDGCSSRSRISSPVREGVELEPRVIKRRPKKPKPLTEPRQQARKRLLKKRQRKLKNSSPAT